MKDDILGVIDGLVAKLAKEVLNLDVPTPLPRMTYDEAMERFGHDAPDLRFGLEIVDLTDLAPKSQFGVFKSVAESGGRVRAICVKGGAEHYSRRGIDALTEFVKGFGAKGLAWFRVRRERQASSTATSPSSSPRSCWPRWPSGSAPSRATWCSSPPTSSTAPARCCTRCAPRSARR